MPRLMYDSVNASSIKAVNPNPQMVAGYADTIVIPQWKPSDWALFPNAVKVQIVKKASSNWGHVLDVEPGDATPAQAPGWVKMRRAAGLATPCVYVQKSSWASVQNEFNIQKTAQPLYWVAHYNDVEELPTLNGIKAIAKQHHGNDPRNFDLSYVADFWPGVDDDNMAFTDDDFTKFFYASPIQEFGNVSQLFANIKQNAKAAANLAQAITDLKNLIIADDANDVTADQVAAKVKAAVSQDVVDAVTATLANVHVTAEVNKAELSDQIITDLLARLAS